MRYRRRGPLDHRSGLRCFIVLLAALVLSAPALGQTEQSGAQARVPDCCFGSYRLAGNHYVGVDRFIMDDGEPAVLFSDYSSGVVRRLFPVSQTEFVMGSGFNSASPVELTVRFKEGGPGAPEGISLQYASGPGQFAQRVPLRTEEVSFQGADAKLAGTLIMPSTRGTHPAIILLHGSGPLTRYSFGPYPHFFSSLGFAVLIYDKRGSGASTGVRVDASTGTAMRRTFYPDEIAMDALAALRFLQKHEEIDPRRIGFWGSSEGGMLALQVAARSNDVAFAINSAGFMGPLWETLRYQVEAILRSSGTPKSDIAQQRALIDSWLQVARTGEGWQEFIRRRQAVVESQGSWIFQSRGEPASVEQARWDWEHVLSFDSLSALDRVSCPVLAVFGGMDVLTESSKAAQSLRRVLTQAGHKDFTIRVFPRASHSLMEMPSRNRMTPGVFQTLRSWLLDRVPVEAAPDDKPGTTRARPVQQ